MTSITTKNNRYQQARKVTIIGSIVDAILSVAKIAIGLIDNSQALIADGVHSLSDLATDVMVLFAVKHGSREVPGTLKGRGDTALGW